jgi:hypothetical protein
MSTCPSTPLAVVLVADEAQAESVSVRKYVSM